MCVYVHMLRKQQLPDTAYRGEYLCLLVKIEGLRKRVFLLSPKNGTPKNNVGFQGTLKGAPKPMFEGPLFRHLPIHHPPRNSEQRWHGSLGMEPRHQQRRGEDGHGAHIVRQHVVHVLLGEFHAKPRSFSNRGPKLFLATSDIQSRKHVILGKTPGFDGTEKNETS